MEKSQHEKITKGIEDTFNPILSELKENKSGNDEIEKQLTSCIHKITDSIDDTELDDEVQIFVNIPHYVLIKRDEFEDPNEFPKILELSYQNKIKISMLNLGEYWVDCEEIDNDIRERLDIDYGIKLKND